MWLSRRSWPDISSTWCENAFCCIVVNTCSKIVNCQVISRCPTKQSSEYEEAEVACPHCNEFFSFSPQYMFGDPRNQAILIHDDGWNPHIHWGHHSIATITVEKMSDIR